MVFWYTFNFKLIVSTSERNIFLFQKNPEQEPKLELSPKSSIMENRREEQEQDLASAPHCLTPC
jgi:hypothetical protein